MPQLHLYVPDDVAEDIKERARSSGQSVSKYLAGLVQRDIGEAWPEGFFEQVVGGWQGEPLERLPQGEFESRDEL